MSCPDKCDHGWVTVPDSYVDHVLPLRRPEQVTDPEYQARRRIAATTVYPCRVCRPEQFATWAARASAGQQVPGSSSLPLDNGDRNP